MSIATITIAFSPVSVPAGLTYAGLKVAITDSSGTAQSQTIPPTTTPTTAADGTTLEYVVTFSNVADGAATVEVSALASDGTVLGTPLTAGGTVGSPAVTTFPQVTTITIS